MVYAIKAAITDLDATTYTFAKQKTMYAGKSIKVGCEIFLFASENEGGAGLFASGVVTSATSVPRRRGVERQTPRVTIVVRRTLLAARALGRSELRGFVNWTDGRPETELNFKFYRQATNKVAGISDETASFLRGCLDHR